jgi:hypothetical protein
MQAASAQDVERFYAGSKLSVVIGHEVGTGFDLYGRALARHMGRFIPGNPNLVPVNMVGVAGFAAANWTYNVAAKDGSVIAHFAHTALFDLNRCSARALAGSTPPSSPGSATWTRWSASAASGTMPASRDSTSCSPEK